MRRIAIRLLAAGLLAAALGQLAAGRAQACIRFDTNAEMAAIDEALAGPKPQYEKVVLRALRNEIVSISGKPSWSSEDILDIHYLMSTALKSLGRERIVATGEPGGQAKLRSAQTKIVVPSCG